MRRIILKCSIIFILFANYAGGAGILFSLVGIFLLYLSTGKLRVISLIFLLVFLLYQIFRAFFWVDELISYLMDLRFFWGFLFILLPLDCIQREQRCEQDLREILRFSLISAVILLIIEYFTSNILLVQWPNRVHNMMLELTHGGWVRAYGFGANSSVTIVIMVSLSLLIFNKLVISLFVAIFTSFSGTGAMAILFASAMRSFTSAKSLLYFLMGFLIAIPIYLFIMLGDLVYFENFNKISLYYINYLLRFKQDQISIYLGGITEFEMFFGRPFGYNTFRAGDFQALDYFSYNGILGVVIFFFLLMSRLNKYNFIPCVILVLSTLHYHVIFSIPGQLIFAYALSVKKSPDWCSVARIS